MSFQRATRKKAKLKLAVTGPSGSGKTYSALRLATGLGGKIAFLDTENGSASLYSDKFEFDVLEITPPFGTEKFIQGINDAVKAGYTTLVIDSISHAWISEGGLVEQKEQLDTRGKGNSYTNWRTITKKHESFKSTILHTDIHIICTMRSKQDYAISANQEGKQKVQKLGMAPIQREGMEYEFTTVFDIGMNHEAEVSKDRTGLFGDRIFKISEETGAIFRTWLEGAADVTPPPPRTDGVAVNKGSETPASPGDYVIPFGKNKGTKIKELKKEDLKILITKIDGWMIDNAAAPGMVEFVATAEAYLKILEIEKGLQPSTASVVPPSEDKESGGPTFFEDEEPISAYEEQGNQHMRAIMREEPKKTPPPIEIKGNGELPPETPLPKPRRSLASANEVRELMEAATSKNVSQRDLMNFIKTNGATVHEVPTDVMTNAYTFINNYPR